MENAQPLNDLRGAMDAAGKQQWIELRLINTSIFLSRFKLGTRLFLFSTKASRSWRQDVTRRQEMQIGPEPCMSLKM